MIETYKTLEGSKEFKGWKAKHKQWFLSHIFTLDEGESQIGFADLKGEKITTFLVKGGKTTIEQTDEIFKEPEKKLLELDLDKVKISQKKALENASELQQKEHSKHSVIKKIIILQNLEIGQVYNITFVTNTFHTLNIKVDAQSGEIVEEKLSSIFDMAQEQSKKDKEKVDYIG
ncbi:MAG: hypothetical protein V1837_01305 [Candidatus Woesearchaeota archaeon]